MNEGLLAHCRVVLVRMHIAANLGATARVMRNMGLSDLVLVAPLADPADREARRLSTHGEGILEQARIVGDLGEALADCTVVAGTSARTGHLERGHGNTPRVIMPRLVDALATGRVALVFGPEPSGLANEEVSRCHWLVHIPAEIDYPAMNLAQAVAICLYELRMAVLDSLPPPSHEPVASFAMQERMFEDLKDALTQIHYLFGPKADSLMHGIRHLLGRAQPTEMEVKLLLGLARQIRWFAEQGHPKS